VKCHRSTNEYEVIPVGSDYAIHGRRWAGESEVAKSEGPHRRRRSGHRPGCWQAGAPMLALCLGS